MAGRDRFPAIFLFFFSLYVCLESSHLGVGNFRRPGPGFLSFWSGVALGILSLLVLFHGWKGKADDEESIAPASWKGRMFCFLSLLVFVFILDTLGFILTSFLFMGFLTKVVEKKSWAISGLFALVVALASYGLFQIGLQSQLPTGILGF